LAKASEKSVKCSEKDENCHWIIDPPNGPVSSGTCKKCGSVKEFKNSFEYNTWHGERPGAKDKDKNKDGQEKNTKGKQG